MSCSPFDLRDYVFGELSPADRKAVEAHARACAACSHELERFRVTEAALFSLREEELPRRIAFVSDKVFEPSWWQTLWSSGPRLGFAGAAMLSAAILFHAVYRPPTPAGDPAPVVTAAAADPAALDRRVAAAVREAVAAAEQRQRVEFARTVEDLEKRYQSLRQEDAMTMQANFNIYRQTQTRRTQMALESAVVATPVTTGGVQ